MLGISYIRNSSFKRVLQQLELFSKSIPKSFHFLIALIATMSQNIRSAESFSNSEITRVAGGHKVSTTCYACVLHD